MRGVGDKEIQNITCRMNKLEEYILEHREYSRYFMVSGVYSIKVLEHYTVQFNTL